MRILHLPTSVGGNAYGLSRGERDLGHSSDVLVAEGNFLGYPADRIVFPTSAVSRAQRIWRRTELLKTFFSIRKAYDVFHFNYGQSLLHFQGFGLPLLEIPYYPKKAKLAFTFNGCDVRQKFPTMERNPFAPCHDPTCYNGMCNSGSLDASRRKMIARMEQYAHAIFALNPDLLHALPARARFLPYTVAGWNDIVPQPWKAPGSRIRIAHAPTNRAAKGSDSILATMDVLQKEYGSRLEFLLVEGVSNREALALYASADLVIDQLRIGWYGGLAVEVLKTGRPVAVYIRQEDLHFIPAEMRQQIEDAFINVSEQTLLNTLRTIIENPDVLKHAARAGLEYVIRWHDPRRVAQMALDSYE